MAASPSGCLFVGDLSVCCRENHLRELFQEFGQVLKTEIKQGQKAFKLLGYGFVTLPSYVEAEAAMNSLNGKLVLGRRLRINWANSTGNHKEIICAEVAFSFISKQLNYMVYEQTIRELFSQYSCEVVDVAIKQYKIDQGANKQSGIGFVHFPLTPEGVLAAKSAVYMLRNVCIKEVMYDCEVSKKLQAILKNHPHLDALAQHIDLSTPETSLLSGGIIGPDGTYLNVPGAPLVPNLNSSSAKGKVSAKPIDIGFELPYVPLYWFEHMLQYSLDEHLTPQQQAQLAIQVQSQLSPQSYHRTSPYPNQHNGRVSPRYQQQQPQQYYRGGRGGQQYYGAQGGYYYYDNVSPQHQLMSSYYDPVTGNYFLSPTASHHQLPQQHLQQPQDMYYYSGEGDGLVDESHISYYEDYNQPTMKLPPDLRTGYQPHNSAYATSATSTALSPTAVSISGSAVESRVIPISVGSVVNIGGAVDDKSANEGVIGSSGDSVHTTPSVNASINVSLQDTNLLSEEQLSATGLTANAPVFKMKTPFPLPPVSSTTASGSLSTSPVPSLSGGGLTPPSVMYGSDFSYANVNNLNNNNNNTINIGLNSNGASAMLLFGTGGSRNRTTSTSSNTSVASSITTTSVNNVINTSSTASNLNNGNVPLPPLLCRSVSDTGYSRILHTNGSGINITTPASQPGSMMGTASGGVASGSSIDNLGDLLMPKSYFSSTSATTSNPLLFSGGSLGGWTSGSQPTSSRLLSTLNSTTNTNSTGNKIAPTAAAGVGSSVDPSVTLPEFDLSLDFGTSTSNSSGSGGDRSPFSFVVGSGLNGLDKVRTSSDFTDRSRLDSNNSVDVNELLNAASISSNGKIEQ